MSKRFLILAVIVAATVAAAYLYLVYRRDNPRMALTSDWFRNPEKFKDRMMKAGTKCGDAPFIFPTDGYVGFIWDDSFKIGHRHQGLDIFAGTDVGVTRVVAAYAGYLTRQGDWKSTVIVRVESDPLNPGQQIWLYYTHMADKNGDSFISPEFPAGTREVYIEAGTLLGYQGNYSGDPLNPVGLHLHFSIVKDDGNGNFLNELEFNNTIDPSPYFNMPLNANKNRDTVPMCAGT